MNLKIKHLFTMITLIFLHAHQTIASEASLVKDERIVFFGDSITQLGAREGGYVSFVSEAINDAYPKLGVQVFGAGVSGNKVGDLLKRLDKDVLIKRPNTVIIYVGTNDIWHWTKPHPVTKKSRDGTTPEAYEAGLRSLILKIQAKKARVLICTPAVIGENLDTEDPNYVNLDKYSEVVRSVASDTDCQLVDLRKAFVDHLSEVNTEKLNKGVLTKDTVHMNDAGNQFIAQQMLTALNVPITTKSSKKQFSGPLYKGDKEDLDLYLLIGQSNMAGRAAIPKNTNKSLKDCFLLNNLNQWEEATNPLNRYSSIRKSISMQKFSPGYSFGKIMAKKNGNSSIGLIVNALGGSRIGSWEKGAAFYEQTLLRARVAMKTGELKGVLWLQGESDYQDAEYLPKLVELVENLRKDLKNENLPFVAAQINNIPLINDQIAKLPTKLKNTAYISSEGLTTQDKWHFDSDSIEEIGERFAKAMLELQK